MSTWWWASVDQRHQLMPHQHHQRHHQHQVDDDDVEVEVSPFQPPRPLHGWNLSHPESTAHHHSAGATIGGVNGELRWW
jgi:hypothetical protein